MDIVLRGDEIGGIIILVSNKIKIIFKGTKKYTEHKNKRL